MNRVIINTYKNYWTEKGLEWPRDEMTQVERHADFLNEFYEEGNEGVYLRGLQETFRLWAKPENFELLVPGLQGIYLAMVLDYVCRTARGT